MPEMPKTLIEIAGGVSRPASLNDSSLVLVDAQREYLDGKLPLAGIEAAIAEAAYLLALARRRGLPVIHIVHRSPVGAALFDSATSAVEIVPPLAPAAGEIVIAKTLPNAFAGTTLDHSLRASGRRGLILAGFMTHMCVSSSARAALDLGYRATVVAAATATRDLPDPLGRRHPRGDGSPHRTRRARRPLRFHRPGRRGARSHRSLGLVQE